MGGPSEIFSPMQPLVRGTACSFVDGLFLNEISRRKHKSPLALSVRRDSGD